MTRDIHGQALNCKTCGDTYPEYAQSCPRCLTCELCNKNTLDKTKTDSPWCIICLHIAAEFASEHDYDSIFLATARLCDKLANPPAPNSPLSTDAHEIVAILDILIQNGKYDHLLYKYIQDRASAYLPRAKRIQKLWDERAAKQLRLGKRKDQLDELVTEALDTIIQILDTAADHPDHTFTLTD